MSSSGPLELQLVCAPPVRGDAGLGQILEVLEALVGMSLRLEVWTDGKCRPARDRAALLGPLMYLAGWPDDRLLLVESPEQQFIAYVSGLTRVDAQPDLGREAVFKSLSIAARLPIDRSASEGLALLVRLTGLGRAYAASLGPPFYDLRLPGRYPVPDHGPQEILLAWLNAWSSEVAAHLGFPSDEDRAHLWQIQGPPAVESYACALTEDPLDLSRPDHAEVYAWAARRFGVKNPRQS